MTPAAKDLIRVRVLGEEEFLKRRERATGTEIPAAEARRMTARERSLRWVAAAVLRQKAERVGSVETGQSDPAEDIIGFRVFGFFGGWRGASERFELLLDLFIY